MIIGNPRWRSSMRFFFVARLWACEATRASGDILLSGIGLRGFMKQLKVRFGETPKPTRETRALPSHHVFA